MTGAWPALLVDHRDRNRQNNAWRNLRDATRLVNQQNVTLQPGAGAHQKRGKWRSSIRINGAQRNLGVFDTAAEASTAYLAAKVQQHGYTP